MRGGRIRLVGRALAVAVVVAVVGAVAAGAGAGTGSTRFTPVTQRRVSSANVKGLSDKTVMAIVQVSGDPVTVADANANQGLTANQKKQIKDDLKQKQAPVADH